MSTIIKAGILSDTHISRPNRDFLDAVRHCFADCEIIIHAGDLTDISVLDAFAGKTVYAVRGNCCARTSRTALPGERSFQLGDFSISLLHGDRLGRYADNIESGLWDAFPDADCVIYGHTHDPVCKRAGGKLIINPGSFQISSWYGTPARYAILEAGEELRGSLHELASE
ncbi:MAG: metallophosphoesterase [Candidatus Electrothrix sp. AUS1_2]|nr:metallophosphoesterase [Candidatus Electrothrix sp. AUS1_2]